MPATGLGGWGRFGTSCQLWWRKETALAQLWGRTTVTSPFRATSVIISGSDKINQLPNCGPRVRRHLHHPIRRPNFHSQRQNSTMPPAHHSQTRWGVDLCPNVHCTCLTILPNNCLAHAADTAHKRPSQSGTVVVQQSVRVRAQPGCQGLHSTVNNNDAPRRRRHHAMRAPRGLFCPTPLGSAEAMTESLSDLSPRGPTTHKDAGADPSYLGHGRTPDAAHWPEMI